MFEVRTRICAALACSLVHLVDKLGVKEEMRRKPKGENIHSLGSHRLKKEMVVCYV